MGGETTMASRNRRRSFLAATVIVILMLAMSVEVAAASSIRSVTVEGAKPGIIDVTITSVGFDKASGVVTVSGSVGCAETLDLLFVDFTAVQSRGRATLRGFSTVVPNCASVFSGVIQSDAPFATGPLVIEATAFACVSGGGCAGEVLQIAAV